MTVRAAEVDGELGVFVDVSDSRRLAEVLREWHRQHVAACRPPRPLVLEVLDSIEVVVSVHGQLSATAGGSGGELISVADAAVLLGLSVRSVRRRAAAGHWPGARQVGRTWLIPAIDIVKERAAA